MNHNGEKVIVAIVRRLKDEGIRCYDTAIVQKLAGLDRYEMSQLVTFGEIDKWLTERNNKARVNDT